MMLTPLETSQPPKMMLTLLETCGVFRVSKHCLGLTVLDIPQIRHHDYLMHLISTSDRSIEVGRHWPTLESLESEFMENQKYNYQSYHSDFSQPPKMIIPPLLPLEACGVFLISSHPKRDSKTERLFREDMFSLA